MQKYKSKFEKENEIKRREELKALYKPNWKKCEEVQGWTDSMDDPLGSLDADEEWSHDMVGACQRFLPINSYYRFIDPSNIILVGRTGTGKSSIFNRYEYAINNQEITDYDMAMTIRFERLFTKLMRYDFGEAGYANYHLRDIFEIVIRLHIINFLIQKNRESAKRVMTDEECEKLEKFMALAGIETWRNADITKKVCNKLDGLQNVKENSIMLEDIANSMRNMYPIFQEEIERILDKVLINYKVLILADSLDTYDIAEKRVVAMSRALLELAIEVANNRQKHRYTLNVAIPSEVFAHIFSTIPTRKKGKVVIIEWSFKDIIRMLAIKVFSCFRREKYAFAKSLIEKYEIGDFLDYEKSQELLHSFLPVNCPATIPVNFEVISYCIKHTQKKPRQVLMIFNSLIHKMYIEDKYDYFIKHPEEIGKYVHKAQQDIIDDALNMYNIYDKSSLLSIVSEVLCNQKNFLTGKELSMAIKGASTEYTKVGLTEAEVRSILIESGIVGKVYRERYVEEDDDFFHNSEICKITLAQFEYQIKGKLITKNCIYVLHPMCYERYANELDINAWVYPEPADDIGDSIISDLETRKIIH